MSDEQREYLLAPRNRTLFFSRLQSLALGSKLLPPRYIQARELMATARRRGSQRSPHEGIDDPFWRGVSHYAGRLLSGWDAESLEEYQQNREWTLFTEWKARHER